MDFGPDKSGLQKAQSEPGVVGQFLQSAAYAGAEAPLRAVAQIADSVYSGCHAEAGVQSAFKAIGVEPPRHADFGTSGWYAQQLGGAVGMMVPFLALRSGVSKLSGAGAAAESLGAAPTLTQLATKEATLSGGTGLIYGSLLRPSDSRNVGTSKFITDRLAAGGTDMASFAALGFASPYIGAGLDSAAGSIQRTALPNIAKESVAATLRSPLVVGMAAGVPGGVVNAEANALSDGRLVASGQEFKESIAGMAFVGGAMGVGTRLIEGAKSTEPSTESKTTDSRPPEAKAEQRKMDSAKEAELRQAVEAALRRIQLNNVADNTPPLNPQERLLDDLARITGKKVSPALSRDSADQLLAGTAPNQYKPTPSPVPGMEVVLGASGIEAPAHAGFLQALADRDVPVGRVTGVSGGSLVATLYANKYTPEQIKTILLSDQFRYPKLAVLADCLHVTDPWNLYPYSIDFKPWLKDFVDTYKLKPQPNLRIVAADSQTHAPVVFEGTNYDLTTALAASTAASGINMKPVRFQGRELIDGFYYHPTPTALSTPPAIASKIGFVSKFPSEPLSPLDYFMHLRELAYYNEFKNRYPDPPGHIVAETGLPDVATTTFGVSKETLQKLIQHGYDATSQRLSEPDAVKAIEEAKKQQKPS